MKHRLAVLCMLVVVFAIGSPGVALQGLAASRPAAAEPDPSPEAGDSLLFIENVGQFDAGARFQVWGGSGTVWLADGALWITQLDCPHPQPLSQPER